MNVMNFQCVVLLAFIIIMFLLLLLVFSMLQRQFCPMDGANAFIIAASFHLSRDSVILCYFWEWPTYATSTFSQGRNMDIENNLEYKS